MDNPETAWEFARACYDWADWATNKAQRAAIAKKGNCRVPAIASVHQFRRRALLPGHEQGTAGAQ